MICKNTCIKKEDVYYHVICLQSNPLLLDSELVFQVQSGLKCTLLSIPPFHPVLPTSIFPLSDHISVSTYVLMLLKYGFYDFDKHQSNSSK